MTAELKTVACNRPYIRATSRGSTSASERTGKDLLRARCCAEALAPRFLRCDGWGASVSADVRGHEVLDLAHAVDAARVFLGPVHLLAIRHAPGERHDAMVRLHANATRKARVGGDAIHDLGLEDLVTHGLGVRGVDVGRFGERCGGEGDARAEHERGYERRHGNSPVEVAIPVSNRHSPGVL